MSSLGAESGALALGIHVASGAVDAMEMAVVVAKEGKLSVLVAVVVAVA